MSDPHLAEAPAAPSAPPQRLDPKVRALWGVGAVIWVAILTGALAVLLASIDQPARWAFPFAVLGLVYAAIVPGKRYERFTYRVSEVELRISHGWLWRTTSVVLHSRVQHVDTRQGPIENALGLATVVVFTAGSVGAMVAIPGLRHGDAEALRDRLVALSGADDAV